VQYWRRLLAVRPLLAAMLDVLGDTFATDETAAREIAALAGARTKASEAEPHLEALANRLVDLDPACDLADAFVADVDAFAGTGAAARLRPARRPAADAVRPHAAGLAGCRAAVTAARQAFVRANLRLVVTMAHRYKQNGRLPLADLIQEGNVGLMTAVDRFDPRRGFRFSTYGSWWIRHAISRALSDTGRTVRLPVHVIELQFKLAKARRDYELQHQHAPSPVELADFAAVPLEKVERLDRVLREQENAPTSEDDDTRPRGLEAIADEFPGADSMMHRERLSAALHDALGDLKDAEVDILTRRFGLDGSEGATLREVGGVYDLSRERIRQLQESALRKLRMSLQRRGYDRDIAPEELAG
jgi:RNA polymerase primary sigma factor